MSHAHEPKHDAIPQVGWHDQGLHSRPGMLHPLPLPLHPKAPAIPGGLPGTIPGRSGVVPGGSLFIANSGSKPGGPAVHVLTKPLMPVHHPVYSLPPDFIPGRSGVAPFVPHQPVSHPTHPPVHVPRPVLR